MTARQIYRAEDFPSVVFPTDNPLDIPTLDLSLQAVDGVHLPFVQWGSVGRDKIEAGTLAFYVDDYRLHSVWDRPEQVANARITALVEPNFSVLSNSPAAVAIWNTYRKRWLARSWQKVAGLKVIVDLNVAPDHYKVNLLGVPKGWRAYCTRGSADDLSYLSYQYLIAREHAGGTDDILFIVYGGGNAVKELVSGWVGAHYLSERAEVVKALKDG